MDTLAKSPYSASHYFLFLFSLYFMCMVFCLQVCLHECSEVKRGYEIPETGIIDCCELSCKFWELNLCLEAQSVCLTAEPSLPYYCFFNCLLTDGCQAYLAPVARDQLCLNLATLVETLPCSRPPSVPRQESLRGGRQTNPSN